MKMTPERAIDVLTTEIACVRREGCKREECGKCDLLMDTSEVLEAYAYAIGALSTMINDRSK